MCDIIFSERISCLQIWQTAYRVNKNYFEDIEETPTNQGPSNVPTNKPRSLGIQEFKKKSLIRNIWKLKLIIFSDIFYFPVAWGKNLNGPTNGIANSSANTFQLVGSSIRKKYYGDSESQSSIYFWLTLYLQFLYLLNNASKMILAFLK